jgi:hypothetical protein
MSRVLLNVPCRPQPSVQQERRSSRPESMVNLRFFLDWRCARGREPQLSRMWSWHDHPVRARGNSRHGRRSVVAWAYWMDRVRSLKEDRAAAATLCRDACSSNTGRVAWAVRAATGTLGAAFVPGPIRLEDSGGTTPPSPPSAFGSPTDCSDRLGRLWRRRSACVRAAHGRHAGGALHSYGNRHLGPSDALYDSAIDGAVGRTQAGSSEDNRTAGNR